VAEADHADLINRISYYPRSPTRSEESGKGRARTARQGDFLALMEPWPTLAPATQATLIPLMAALLLEAAEAEAPDRGGRAGGGR
jgi:hypothetical protein